VNLRDLDLNLLLVFSAVMRRRSATLAGEELLMTQSAISNALRRLRLHFSDPLFVKTPQGMMPTVLAERLAGPLLDALERIGLAVDSVQVFDPAKSERRFALYTSDVGQLILVPRLLRRIARRHLQRERRAPASCCAACPSAWPRASKPVAWCRARTCRSNRHAST
jgi:DNA-binding transcriptional LysR family regulator